MARSIKSTASQTVAVPPVHPGGWLIVGAIAAASAAALGGLAAAWFYRKTLSRLRDAESEDAETEIPDSGAAARENGEEDF